MDFYPLSESLYQPMSAVASGMSVIRHVFTMGLPLELGAAIRGSKISQGVAAYHNMNMDVLFLKLEEINRNMDAIFANTCLAIKSFALKVDILPVPDPADALYPVCHRTVIVTDRYCFQDATQLLPSEAFELQSCPVNTFERCASDAQKSAVRSQGRLFSAWQWVLLLMWCSVVSVVATFDTLTWTEQAGTSNYNYGYGVSVSLDGFIYVTGYSSGSLNGQPYAGGRWHSC